MNKLVATAIMLVLVLALIAACSPSPTPVPPTQPPAAPTKAPATPVPPTTAPTNPPPPPPPTSVPPTAVPPAPTAVPPTVAPTNPPPPPPPPPAPTVPSGLFVSNIRLSPEQPAFNQNISFTPTFVNGTSTVQNFTWKVYIWRADTVTKTDNETTAILTSFPVGSGEFPSLGTYRYGATGFQCEYFFARVGWLDADNKITFFASPDGKTYEKGFKICDPSIIPTAAPKTAPPSPLPPPPGPGLFVTNLRLQPFDTPQHNMTTTFFATFQNTSSNVQTFTWRVYIFRADSPTKSNIETTNIQTSFPVGTQEVQSLGTFTYGSTGYDCDYFFARVGWIDGNNVIHYFTKPDGLVYEKGFQVCK